MELLECEISQLLIDEQSAGQTVILREKNGGRMLPIEIGMVEALAINNGLQVGASPRPMTHDLLLAVLRGLGGKLERVTVNDLLAMPHGGATFLAMLEIRTADGHLRRIDSRPSDALALMVRIGCPLFVNEKVLQAAGMEGDL